MKKAIVMMMMMMAATATTAVAAEEGACFQLAQKGGNNLYLQLERRNFLASKLIQPQWARMVAEAEYLLTTEEGCEKGLALLGKLKYKLLLSSYLEQALQGPALDKLYKRYRWTYHGYLRVRSFEEQWKALNVPKK